MLEDQLQLSVLDSAASAEKQNISSKKYFQILITAATVVSH